MSKKDRQAQQAAGQQENAARGVEGVQATPELSRRAFLAGGAAVGALAVAGSVWGCAPKAPTPAGEATDDQHGSKAPAKIDKEYTTDMLIVGVGGSGMTCCVQAALNGTDFIAIEKADLIGGNANFVEGMFAIGSKFQKERGINITPAQIIEAEMSRGQYRQNGSMWMDLCVKSAENIDWCLEQGVLYSGVIDDYYGGLYPTFHWFKDNKSKVGFVEPMTQRIKELGATIHLKTSATSLIFENGAITGAYAEGPEGVIKYNAKAVILAGGGFGGSPDVIAKQGWDTEDIFIVGSPNAAGDSYRMATEIGALDMLSDAAQSILYNIQAFPRIDFANDAQNPINGYFGIASGGPMLWVNEYGDRFARENLTTDNLVLQCIPGKANKANYCIFDQAIFEAKFGTSDEAKKMFNDSLATNNGNSLYAADSIEKLAGFFKHDPAALKATIERYNELANQGVDEDYGKPADLMLPITGGPYYIAKLNYTFFFSVGGFLVNRQRQVLDTHKEPIKGLYAIGNDGNNNYRNVYTINMPGTAFGNQVNSGREAANYVKEYLAG
ncbi:MAG: FAD-binding protein [Coriobacteriales bacterium]|jgi:fumarate reductase flavoprotein subunit|nr:FAD-binding protein [Coriobacteriales bacterium]